MKSLTISQKLTGSYLLLGIITVITISIFFYQGFKKALIERTLAQLSSINILKKEQIEEHFKARARNLNILVKNPLVTNIFFNPYKSDDELKKLVLENNYKNFFLIDSNLRIISQSTPVSGSSSFHPFLIDCLKHFCLYDASADNNIFLLIGRPVEDDKKKVIGAIIVEEDYASIEKIVYERTGMGNTGETYLVGPDGYMRSVSRFFPTTNPLSIKVQTTAFQNASKAKEGNGIIKDYREVSVLSAYRNLFIPGLRWTIISEIDFEEAMMPVYQVRDYIVVIGFAITILIIVVTIILSQAISKPVIKLREVVLLLSKGILPPKAEINKSDEIGQMAQAINQLVEGLKKTSHFANEIGNGNFSSSYTPLSDEDILGKNLVQMRDKLKKSSEQEKNISLQRTFALVEGQESERRRISRELHDGIGQLLTATKFRVGAIEGQDEIRKEIKNILDETIAEVRRISNNLMPSVLIDFGLEAGLRLLCSNIAKYSDMPIHLNFNNRANKELNFEISVSLYRIAQEGINNSIKYSEASLAELSVFTEETFVSMELKDNGKGFDIEDYMQQLRKDSNGIRNMKERAQLLNGKFYINSALGEGTTIKVIIPLTE